VKLQLLKTVIERLTEITVTSILAWTISRGPATNSLIAQRSKKLQRNFQGYSTRAGADIYSSGCRPFRNPDAYWQNEKKLLKYYAARAGRAPLTQATF